MGASRRAENGILVEQTSGAISLTIRNFIRSLISVPTNDATSNDAIFRLMVEHSGDVISYVIDGRFTYVSPSAQLVFGWSPSAMIGTDGFHLIYPPDLPILKQVLSNRNSGSELGPISHQLRVICGDGSTKWSETSAHSGLIEDGKTHTILVIRDITDRKLVEEQLQSLALKDGLTGLYNRRAFDEVFDGSWRQTLRQGSGMALLMLDIDYFKGFNDSYGHLAGDDCLRLIAATISKFVRRHGDIACRYGGEEFAVILSDISLKAAVEIADEIRSAVAALGVPHQLNPHQHVTISIGVAAAMARVGSSVKMPESLLQAADHALYKAKAGGRNRVEQAILIAPPGS